MQPELFWHQRKRFNICFTYHTQKVHRFLSNIRFEWKETAKTNGRKICLSVDSRRHRYSVTVNGWESGADWKSQLNSSLFTKIPGAEYIQVGRSRGCQDPQVLSHSYSKHSSTLARSAGGKSSHSHAKQLTLRVPKRRVRGLQETEVTTRKQTREGKLF